MPLRRSSARDDRSSPAQRLALPVAALVAAFTFGVLQLLHRLFASTGADFRAMLQGASDLAMGRDLYAPAIHFLGGGNLRKILDMQVTLYVYPPPLAILLRPLTLLPPSLALVLWDLLNVTLAAILFVLVVRVSRARSMRELVLIGALYGFFPLNMGLGTGQIDLTISVLGLLTFLFYRGGSYRRAGLALALAVLIKPTVGVLLLFYICRGAWKVVATCLAIIASGLGVSLLAVGGKVLWEYRQIATGWANAFGVLPLNQSLHGLVLRLLAPRIDVPPTGIAANIGLAAEVLLLMFALLAAALLLRRGEPHGLREGSLQYYATFTVLLLGLPFTENLHLTWILPGVGLLFVVMAQQRNWHIWHATAVGSYLLLALPFAEFLTWHADASIAGRLLSGTETYGLLALGCTACYAAFVVPRASGEKQRPLAAVTKPLTFLPGRGA